MRHRHVRSAVLVAYAAYRLPATRRAQVAAQVRGCAVCEAEVAAWTVAAEAARAAVPVEQPSRAVVEAALTRVANVPVADVPVADVPVADVPVAGGGMRAVCAMVAGQVPVLRRGIWAASAVMFVLGAALCLARGSQAGSVLALVAPLVAALGVCVVYGPQVDPALELVLAAPTSPRLVLLARLALVAGFDLGVALAVSGALVAVGAAPGLWPLVGAWLGPMALLSALSLLLAVWQGPVWGASCAFLVWGLRVLAAQDGRTALLTAGQAAWITRAWSTSLPVFVTAAILLGLAVLTAPYRSSPRGAVA